MKKMAITLAVIAAIYTVAAKAQFNEGNNTTNSQYELVKRKHTIKSSYVGINAAAISCIDGSIPTIDKFENTLIAHCR